MLEKIKNPVDEDYELIKSVKKVTAEILSELVRVCDDNDLKVYPMYGSLLGTARLGGALPFDDDIDVTLSRADYNKLLELGENGAFANSFFLQTPKNDDCFFGGYAKLRKSNTTAIHPYNWWKSCNEGIAIDIFPMDFGYGNRIFEKIKLFKIRMYQRLLYAKHYGFFPRFMDMPLPVWKFYKYWSKLYSDNLLEDKLDKTLQASDGCTESSRFGIYTHYSGMGKSKVKYFNPNAFADSKRFSFEGSKLYLPKDYDSILKNLYGDNYMEPLKYNPYKLRHGFYSVDVPYPVYKERFGGLKHISDVTAPVILVGDKRIRKLFHKQYGDKVSVAGEYNSDQISNLKSKFSNPYIILCGVDQRLLEKSVREAGFSKYYFYWYDRNWMLRANVSSIMNDVTNIKECNDV